MRLTRFAVAAACVAFIGCGAPEGGGDSEPTVNVETPIGDVTVDTDAENGAVSVDVDAPAESAPE